jgi:hypothetical protein
LKCSISSALRQGNQTDAAGSKTNRCTVTKGKVKKMENTKEGRARFNLIIGEGFWKKLVKPFWLITVSILIQTVVIVYLAFYQPIPKIDSKLSTMSNALLDMEARISSVEQEQLLLFKLLREEENGVLPDVPSEPASIPLPPPPSRTIGDAAPTR